MIKIKYVLILIAFTGFIVSCKSKSVVVDSEVQQNTEINTVIVDFYSKGSGINHKAYAKIDSLLNKQKSNCEFDYNLVKYGREGERQICISSIEENCKKSLLGIINSFQNTELIRITENGKCRN